MTLFAPLDRLRAACRREFQVYQALDRDSAAIRARHLQAVQRLTPLLVLANLVNGAVVALAFGGVSAWLWFAVLGLFCGVGLRAWWRRRGRPRASVTPTALHRTVWAASLLAAWWAVPTLGWFPGAAPPQQLLLATLVTGMMCGGAFALAPLPKAALGLIGVLAGAAMVALRLDGTAGHGALQVLLAVYVTVLVVCVLSNARNFTARLVSEREAARQGQLVGLLLRDFEEHAADLLWETGVGGCFSHVSPRLAAALGMGVAELQGLGLVEALARRGGPDADGHEDDHLGALRAALAQGKAFRDLVVPLRQAGGLRWWSLTAKPLLDEAGHQVGWRGVIADVTQARESHRRLAYLAHFDSLTGLANRVQLRERLTRALAALQSSAAAGGRAPARQVGLICLDVDHFKTINDTLGHGVGDGVLQVVAQRLQSCLRQADLAARLGGDEFALVIDGVQQADELQALAQRLVQVLCQPCEIDGRAVPVSVSLGVALAPDHGRTLDELMASADLALYAAKAAGRGRHELFVPRLGDRRRRRLAIESALRGAVERGELTLHWQPRVDVAAWRVTGAEVLLRWRHPELGWVDPHEFIVAAEETRQIAVLGAWALQQACGDAVRHLDAAVGVSVNVSAAQLLREDFLPTVRQALAGSGLPAARLEIEVTESLFLGPSPVALDNLHGLRELGVRVALDDFGTGYSSLAYLRRFPFDTLKIDRSFVRELLVRHDARAIVKTIVELAQSLGMDTIAEGVEEPAQLAVLREAGCAAVQGYLVARPMPLDELSRLLANWRPAPGETIGTGAPAASAASTASRRVA